MIVKNKPDSVVNNSSNNGILSKQGVMNMKKMIVLATICIIAGLVAGYFSSGLQKTFQFSKNNSNNSSGLKEIVKNSDSSENKIKWMKSARSLIDGVFKKNGSDSPQVAMQCFYAKQLCIENRDIDRPVCFFATITNLGKKKFLIIHGIDPNRDAREIVMYAIPKNNIEYSKILKRRWLFDSGYKNTGIAYSFGHTINIVGKFSGIEQEMHVVVKDLNDFSRLELIAGYQWYCSIVSKTLGESYPIPVEWDGMDNAL